MPTTNTNTPNRAAVRRGVLRGKKAADALDTLSTTCTTGSTCTEVLNDPVASKALGVLQTAVTTAQASQTTRSKLEAQARTARRTAAADYRDARQAASTYEQAVGVLAKGDATIITKAGCAVRPESGPHAALEAVVEMLSKLGKYPTEAVVSWPAAPGATSYAVEVNWTPQNPTGTFTAIGSGTARRWVIKAPTPGAQFLVRVAALGPHGEQAAWSTAILATAADPAHPDPGAPREARARVDPARGRAKMLDVMERRALTAVAALILTACARPSSGGATGADPAGTSASVAPSASPAPPPERAPAPSAAPAPTEPDLSPPSADRIPAAFLPVEPAEPRRSVLRRVADERLLAPHEARIREHFEGTIPSPLEVQTAALPGDRRAFLVYGEPRRRHPLLLVTSASGELLWTKERPLAGTRQVVTEMVVTPGPRGEVAMLWCDIPTQVVGLRRWAADGVVLADFEVIEVDVCEALSALYWPARGWVAVASQHGAARAQILDEAGKRAWGPRGSELPWTARPSSPASIAVDSDVSVVLFQAGFRHADGEASAAPERLLAMRYDTLGTALWPQPLDLGVAPAAPSGPAPRIAVARTEPGKLRVSIGPRATAIVTSAGAILGGR